MTSLLIAPLPGNETLADGLARELRAKVVSVEIREFPDGETYLRHSDNIRGQDLAIVCTLDHPDPKLIRAYLAAASARELAPAHVNLEPVK